MFRYLRKAFWAGSRIPILGRIPWNALAVAGAAIYGFGEHSVWLAGAGIESVYLLAMAASPQFRRSVDAGELERLQGSDAAGRDAMLKTLSPVTVNKYRALEKKVADIERLYRLGGDDDLLFDNNLDALRKLMLTYLRLLAAQRSLFAVGHADEAEIRTQIDGIEKSLQQPGGSESLRQSREATLALLNQRLRNLGRREESLAEIASDLTRIETQIDLALEDATLQGKPAELSAHLEFVSHLLVGEGLGESTPHGSPALQTTSESNSEAPPAEVQP